jgi:Uma2 family endonuclease
MTTDTSSLRFESVTSFLDWQARQPRRYELVGGRPRMQAGANRGHERIAKAVARALESQIDPARFDVNKSDFAVEVGLDENGRPIVRYPDVVVDAQTGNDRDRIAVSPILIVEVLSRSTEKVDVEVKPQEYGSIASLQAYVVCDCDRPVVQVWQRDARGGWPAQPSRVERGAIHLPALNAWIEMDAVYAATPLRRR